ncbi:IS1595 family transposase [Sphingopyxis sp. OPL5]|uniref:IS1595 family transposase n=1 Tax=Sphingopyxis sp. OPL5 TaxID=2486273 RepID=UPI00164E1674|nr:IS1595 family transposase [Sphingopyxis sp. OPL5]QNO29035.1 IS1595 family transposase [Sphingopyxis sp. OPL5]
MTHKPAIQSFDTLFQMMAAFPDEQSAIDHFTAIRWADGAFCPLCGSTKVYHFSDKRTHKCGDCKKRFSIKVGTIFEDTKIELRKWMMAIWLITSHKKGIASTQLAKDIGVTQKTAWFMLHRLRHAARTQSFNRPLDGEVEIDETYVGGKAVNRHKGDPKNGPGTSGKVAVIGALQRGGKAVATVIDRTDTRTLDTFAHAVVSPTATLVSTDEHSGYRHLGRTYSHGVVRHSAGEYVVGNCHTNGIEGFWALLKRQIVGIHHFVSPKHLNAYVSESTWRFNLREMGEGARVNALLAETNGRLRYKELIA